MVDFAPARTIHFSKMEGAGNDFVVIDNRQYELSAEALSELAPGLCERRTGIGADGLLALNEPGSNNTHFRMLYFNADGSRASMCGNGARCIARFAYDIGIQAKQLFFDTDAGIYQAVVQDDEEANVQLFVPAPQGFREKDLIDDEDTYYYIWTGTPHVVRFVDDVADVAVEAEGVAVRENDRYQPGGTNVNFVEVVDAGAIQARTYEKGVEAETEACGTGAIAAAVVARLLERVQEVPVTVEMPGGTLRVGFDLSDNELQNCYLEGPAVTTFTGSVQV